MVGNDGSPLVVRNLIKGWIIASSMLYLRPRLAHLTNLIKVLVKNAEEFVTPSFQTHSKN